MHTYARAAQWASRNSSSPGNETRISWRIVTTACRWLAVALLLLCIFPCRARAQGGALVNGSVETGAIASGATDSWTFSAAAGDGIYVRVGAADFPPRIQLFGPDNAPLQDVKAAAGYVHDVWLTAQAASSGTFTVLISSTSTAAGSYTVSLGEALEPIVVSSGHEGGPLQNGASNAGNIALGGVDAWRFTANAGDSLMLRMSSAAMAPWIQLYGPNGGLVQDAKAGAAYVHDVWMTLPATNSGTYTVMVSSTFAGGIGDYTLTLAQAPESFVVSPNDEGGPMQNGASNAGTITLGDADMWSFTANAGDSLVLRAGAADTLAPWIQLYGPTGALVQEVKAAAGYVHDVWMTLQATNSGTYTVVVSSTFYGGTGDYTLTLAQAPESFVVSPNDQGGPMQNGASNAGTITLGDADMWSFTANAGDSLVLRAGAADTLAPWLQLYGPTGALVQEVKAGAGYVHDVWMSLQATNSGTYTVVVSSTFYGGTGDYTLTLAQDPEPFVTSTGDQGGALTNGTPVAGTISLGDLDMWKFTAQAGDGVMLRAGAADMAPWLQLYGPTGALVQEVKAGAGYVHDVWMTLQATNSGTYTVVVSSTFYGGTGDYTLTLAQAPEPVVVLPGQPGGPLTNGVTNTATLNLGGLSVWSYYGTPGDSNVLRAASPDFSPWLLLWGPDGKLLQDVKSGAGYVHSITLSQVITNAGTYTVALGSTFQGDSGAYTLKESRVPPDLNVPETQVIDELTALNVSISAQNPDVPATPLRFALLSGPTAMKITSGGATNATLSWATTEVDGPSTNTIVVTVTDPTGKGYTRTNSFTVVVNEINTPPQLTVPPTQTVNELTPLNVSVSATDSDIPANPLTFSLLSPPQGMTIDPNTGAISWTPTEAQGPSTTTVTVVVTDSNPWAVNAQHLSDTNTFTVVVNEINTPPQLTVPATQTIDELTPLTVSVSAIDSDIPANPLTFSLIASPTGMTIDPNSGAIAWTPTEAQGPSTNTITVVVTDSNPAAVNAQHLRVTNSFTVIVREINTPPVLTVPATQTIDELTPLTVSASATDSDIPANPLTFSLVAPPTGMNIDSNTGAISWTPTEAQGPSTNTITVVVTDFNPLAANQQHLSATNSFTVVVREINTPPVLTVPATQTIDELTPLNVSASATDSDIPANPLTFSLVAPPTGMNIDPNTGAISWTPTEAQGPSTNTITVVVTDFNPPAANQQHLSATNSFTVVVREVNTQPVLQPIADQSLHFGIPLSLQAVASDSDIPAQTLTFSLDPGAPTNLTINASSGAISWTPSEAQVGTHAVTVRVTDNGSPPLSATTTFNVTVVGQGSQLKVERVTAVADQLTVQLSISGDTGHSYELQKSTDLKTWNAVVQLTLSTSPFTYIDPEPSSDSLTFYRLRLVQ
jgi:Putative Ig domain